MTTRVYRFGCRPPTEGLAEVRAQLRAAREYRNDLVAIERGRRHALRAIDMSSPDVLDAEAVVRAATKSSRATAIAALRAARKHARAEHADDLARIAALDKSICRDARDLTSCFWGSYLDVEAAHRQARSAPFYEDDAVTPSDPSFVYARADGLAEGQVGIQIQSTKPLATAGAWQAEDTRVRLEPAPAFANELDQHGRPRNTRGRKAILSLRVGSDGRAPVWARWPIWLDREVPDAAQWKWVRVSVRLHGPHERWSCEITVDDRAPTARSLDASLTGAVAVEWCWDVLDGDVMRVAAWADTLGQSGEVLLPARIATGLHKASGIRSVRDMITEEARPRISRAIVESRDHLPLWLARAGQWVAISKSSIRLHDLLRTWQDAMFDGARDAYDLLLTWAQRDSHLWEYETGMRRGAQGQRTDVYRVLARQWAGRYKRVLLSDQDLSREARWGDAGEARFRAACDDLRSALRNAFGDEDAIMSRWRDEPGEEEERAWCERTRDAWMAGGARGDGRFAERKEKVANAWAARKAKSAAKRAAEGTAREPSATCAR